MRLKSSQNWINPIKSQFNHYDSALNAGEECPGGGALP